MSGGFFPMIGRMRYIQRWGLMRNTQPENIQEHSHMVAVLAHALALIENTWFDGQVDPGQVAAAALYHDAEEIITGDLPTPIKYHSTAIRSAYGDVEAAARRRLLEMLPPQLRPAYEEILAIPDPHVAELVKAADKLSAYLKCVEEMKAGNLEFRLAKEQTYRALADNPLPALQYFLREMLPEFELTLDELQQGEPGQQALERKEL